jgi:hypothetical protein
MARAIPRLASLVCGLAIGFAPAFAFAQSDQNREIEQRLNELKAMKKELARTMHDFDARIKKLEAAEKAQAAREAQFRADQEALAARPAPQRPQPVVVQASASTHTEIPLPSKPPTPQEFPEYTGAGDYVPGKGFLILRGKGGEVSVSLIAYVRYLNQSGLDSSYTDSFGRKFNLKLRQDIQFNKVNLSFKGWLLDPDFEYRVWVWTQQPAMGDPAQVVVGGHLGYHFAPWFNLFGGIAPLPSTRSTNWSYPMWLKMDNRTVADEFFRASYTQGFWADGKIAEGLYYRAMIANNLSALGISASQLDGQINTMSFAAWWMPTTGEYGPALGFGDFEGHENAATMFGLHYTRSREDRQSQPSTDAIENSQIRLSDGTLLFSPNAFNTGGQVDRASYQMLDFDAGVKWHGLSLEGEYYARWIGDLDVTGFIPVTSLFDQGYQLQASGMILKRQLQAYVAGSQIFGQYGNPWDVTLGMNWYPFDRREMHVNLQGIYLHHSPVGGPSYPYIVGGNGWLWNSDFIVTF